MTSFNAPLIRKVSHISKKLVICKWGSSSARPWKVVEFWSIWIKCVRSSKLLVSTFGALIAAPRLPTVGCR
ncbi:hypothetical protein HanRHA438_Chr06g0274571 [Helianthus annuus]|nr:hypothetical protein HanRHA438_Chr06g0274571 [Helianthus annuus]